MLVSLYTSRVVLNTLGVEDYGIYNVVGGFVAMFGFLNGAMSGATQRFLAYEIGKKNNIQLYNVFSMSVNIHYILALIILLLLETIGVWFLNTQLTIPYERLIAAQWVFHFSVFTSLISFVSVPYNAIIIAHERMNVFAWVSIIEVFLKLLIVFMLQWFGFDKLKLYAVLMFSVSLVIRLIYGIYCKQNFSESKFRFFWDINLFKTLISYAGWNLWGNMAFVIEGQGVNILLNIFFGPIVNAARGIAFQVKSAVQLFASNFQIAINPQIIKSYASDDLKYMHQLIFKGAKYSYFLLFVISLPILLETEIILRLWLNNVPEYTVIFTRLVIINILIDIISNTLTSASYASGNIRLFQTVIALLMMLNLPVSYFFLKLGFQPEITMYISIFISIIALFARLKIVNGLIKLKVKDFIKIVLLKITSVTFIASFIPFLMTRFLSESLFRLFLSLILSFTSVLIVVYYIGIEVKEREFVKIKTKKIINKLRPK